MARQPRAITTAASSPSTTQRPPVPGVGVVAAVVDGPHEHQGHHDEPGNHPGVPGERTSGRAVGAGRSAPPLRRRLASARSARRGRVGRQQLGQLVDHAVDLPPGVGGRQRQQQMASRQGLGPGARRMVAKGAQRGQRRIVRGLDTALGEPPSDVVARRRRCRAGSRSRSASSVRRPRRSRGSSPRACPGAVPDMRATSSRRRATSSSSRARRLRPSAARGSSSR